MPAVKHREKIKKRFLQAVELIAQENYPKKVEADIIRSLGFAPPNYYKMRSTTGNYPTLDHCYQLCTRYQISADWLLTGKGDVKKIDVKEMKPAELLRTAIRMIGKK